MPNATLILALAALVVSASCGPQTQPDVTTTGRPAQASLVPVARTSPVAHDADDPAVWLAPDDPAKSLIIGTDKEYEVGGLYVWNLDGNEVFRIENLDRPNNVDVEYGLEVGGESVDIVVATERGKKRLLIYAIDPTGKLTQIKGDQGVFAGQTGEESEPMGIALYKQPETGKVYAIVGRKSGPGEGYLWQYELVPNGDVVDLKKVREFGNFGGVGEIEAIAVDDDHGRVYCADEGAGLRQYHADPNAPDAGKQLSFFGTGGYDGDREGIAIYEAGDEGWILSTDQVAGGSKIFVYPRRGPLDIPSHTVMTPSDDTDGIEIVSVPLGTKYPEGILVMMNSRDQNFLVYDWRDVRRAGGF